MVLDTIYGHYNSFFDSKCQTRTSVCRKKYDFGSA